MISLLFGLGQLAFGLATFASEGWSGRPRRVVISRADLINLMLVQFVILLAIGAVMCALAAGSAILLKSLL